MYFFQHTNYWRKSVAAGLSRCMLELKLLLRFGRHKLALSKFHPSSIYGISLHPKLVASAPGSHRHHMGNKSSMHS